MAPLINRTFKQTKFIFNIFHHYRPFDIFHGPSYIKEFEEKEGKYTFEEVRLSGCALKCFFLPRITLSRAGFETCTGTHCRNKNRS